MTRSPRARKACSTPAPEEPETPDGTAETSAPAEEGGGLGLTRIRDLLRRLPRRPRASDAGCGPHHVLGEGPDRLVVENRGHQLALTPPELSVAREEAVSD